MNMVPHRQQFLLDEEARSGGQPAASPGAAPTGGAETKAMESTRPTEPPRAAPPGAKAAQVPAAKRASDAAGRPPAWVKSPAA